MGIEFEAWDDRIDDTTHAVSVRGEIDLFTAPEFKQRINAAIDAGRERILVDLTETSFIDSSSLGVLIAAHRRLRLRGGSLVVVSDNRAVLNTFRVTGLEGVFEIARSRDDALASDERAAA
jgi:anti-sigma B factor antagonist